MNVNPEYSPLDATPTAEPLSEDGKLTRQERWLAGKLADEAKVAAHLDALRQHHNAMAETYQPTRENRAQRRARLFGRLK